jgi:positive regulator of sigma E activity
MIFHPAIIALYVSSVLISFTVLYSTFYGVQILRRWDIQSGSELQLILERKTYLISTLLAYLFGFQLLSLFLYIFTVDQLHTFFVGAMCAAGSLYANDFGYPALILKMINFLLAGLWLILNYADNQAYDYPLIKKKYSLLLILTPLIFAEMILQANYFLRLRPDIITSCCGTLFSSESSGLASEISVLPSIPMKVIFYLSMILTAASGIYYYRSNKGGYLFSSLSAITFLTSIMAILSFISVYFYELPTHHCPFCILQKEYGYIGYPLYLTLLGGTISGVGVGVLMPFRNIKSLSEVLPSVQKRLTLASLILFILFTAIITYRIVFSNLILEGY